MPKVKHEWLQEIAHSFGMSVKEFADCIGYKRQRLYKAETGESLIPAGRMVLVRYKLNTLNWELRERELQKADERYREREKMIMELQERLGKKAGANGNIEGA